MGCVWYLVKPDKSEVFELGSGAFRHGFPFCTTNEEGWRIDNGPLLVNWTTVYTCLSNWCFIWPAKHAEQDAEFAEYAERLAWRVREWVGIGKMAYLCHENDVMGMAYGEFKDKITGSVYDDYDYDKSYDNCSELTQKAQTNIKREELLQEKPPVLIAYNDEAGEPLWSVVIVDEHKDAGFWLDSFETREEARDFCTEHDLCTDYPNQRIAIKETLEGKDEFK